MALQLPSPPPNTYDLIRQAISGLSVAGGVADQVTKVADPSRLNAALPHKVYTLGSADIARGRNLDYAQLVAWRFLIQYGLITLADLEFLCDAQGGNLRFSSLNTGPFAQGTRDVVARAEALDPVRQGSYELRALRAPSVYVMAVWLKDLSGQNDIVLPIAPGPTALTGGAPRSSNDFLQGLRSAATTSLGFDSTPQPGGGQGPPGGVGGMPSGRNRPRQ
jgi:hypothetical protein